MSQLRSPIDSNSRQITRTRQITDNLFRADSACREFPAKKRIRIPARCEHQQIPGDRWSDGTLHEIRRRLLIRGQLVTLCRDERLPIGHCRRVSYIKSTESADAWNRDIGNVYELQKLVVQFRVPRSSCGDVGFISADSGHTQMSDANYDSDSSRDI